MESLLLGCRIPGMHPLPSSPHDWEFPNSQRQGGIERPPPPAPGTMEPYALEIRAGVGRTRAGGGLVVCTLGSPACQDPTQHYRQAGYKGILARILRGPPRSETLGASGRQCQPLNGLSV